MKLTFLKNKMFKGAIAYCSIAYKIIFWATVKHSRE